MIMVFIKIDLKIFEVYRLYIDLVQVVTLIRSLKLYQTCRRKNAGSLTRQFCWCRINKLNYLTIYMKNLHDSDWLKAAQLLCNSVQKFVISCNYNLKANKPIQLCVLQSSKCVRSNGLTQFLFFLKHTRAN